MPAAKVKSFDEALLDVQKELGDTPLVKNAQNPHFKSSFLSLNSLLDTVIPILNKHGFSLTQPLTESVTGQPALDTILERGDERRHWTTPLVLTKTDPQALGSAITYTRRYSIQSLLSIVADDDDGESAMPARELQKQQAEVVNQPPAVPNPAAFL